MFTEKYIELETVSYQEHTLSLYKHVFKHLYGIYICSDDNRAFLLMKK